MMTKTWIAGTTSECLWCQYGKQKLTQTGKKLYVGSISVGSVTLWVSTHLLLLSAIRVRLKLNKQNWQTGVISNDMSGTLLDIIIRWTKRGLYV